MVRDTSQQGLISQTAVLNRVVQLGFEVLLPWADHPGYDLAYYTVEEHRSFGFFVQEEAHLVRIQVKTGRITKDKSCIEFNTGSISAGKRGNVKKGYLGKAEYFAIYVPDTGGMYKVPVDKAPQRKDMTLRFKEAGVIRSNGRQSWHVSYEEAVRSGVKYNWAEDYEL